MKSIITVWLLVFVYNFFPTCIKAHGELAGKSQNVTFDAVIADLIPQIIELYNTNAFYSKDGAGNPHEVKKTATLSVINNAGKLAYWCSKFSKDNDVYRTVSLINALLGLYSGVNDIRMYVYADAIAHVYKDPQKNDWLNARKYNRIRDQVISFAMKVGALLLANYEGDIKIPLLDIKGDKATVPYLAIGLLFASQVLDILRLSRNYQIMLDKPLEHFETIAKTIAKHEPKSSKSVRNKY